MHGGAEEAIARLISAKEEEVDEEEEEDEEDHFEMLLSHVEQVYLLPEAEFWATKVQFELGNV